MMLVYALPARREGKLPASRIDDRPMTPARYIQLRRTAEGLTRQEVARRICSAPLRLVASYDLALQLINMLETPGTRATYRETIEVLSRIAAFDVDVYWQLANDPVETHPRICRGCGCSTFDPCHGTDGICSLDHDRCTRCADHLDHGAH